MFLLANFFQVGWVNASQLDKCMLEHFAGWSIQLYFHLLTCWSHAEENHLRHERWDLHFYGKIEINREVFVSQ